MSGCQHNPAFRAGQRATCPPYGRNGQSAWLNYRSGYPVQQSYNRPGPSRGSYYSHIPRNMQNTHAILQDEKMKTGDESSLEERWATPSGMTTTPQMLSSPPTLKASSQDLPSTADTTPTEANVDRKPQDIWKTRYLLERRLLSSPPNSKPVAIFFFTDKRLELTRESPNTLRRITRAYSVDQIFGTAPARKAHLRPLVVTFRQIWERERLNVSWEQHGTDHQGYLEIEERELGVQLQRHHVPGLFFVYLEGGNVDINDPCDRLPDVYYQIVDASNQNFVRCENVYDLKMDIMASEGQTEVSFEGIDGERITACVEGHSQILIKGKGMSRDYEGSSRGDLIINLIQSS
jgi:hypothetical protein